jgi:ATP-dependent helicase YprA (DUF1998 family)/predicted RNA-binding Zn-ribbon protein involved in translation (DUF1610 family)
VSELLPTVQAASVREGLVDYLATTFSLTEPRAADALEAFLRAPGSGIFRGPFLRLRLPFRGADDSWRQHLSEWAQGFTPYGHQAEAFIRLSSMGGGRPKPTLVTTGTGSGKTEAFLYPILDHVIRARRAGQGGMKALLLYPMNALANDQAQRLARMIAETPELAGVTAALYTGEDTSKRTTVTAEGLITHRGMIRQSPPDILLTNYKMLDQLLLRHDDAGIWEQSAHSLQYLVLDEFHTYDGAQGTDVAMLLRRLGLRLAAVTGQESERPLGRITPIATSATLGDEGDPAAMLDFAHTVFGERFDGDTVVTESRLAFDEWRGDAEGRVAAAGFSPSEPTRTRIVALAAAADAGLDSRERAIMVARLLFEAGRPIPSDVDDVTLLDLAKAHPLIARLVERCADAASLEELAVDVLGGEDLVVIAKRESAVEAIVAFLSHIRAQNGRAAVSVDLHLWIRELTRIDRVAAGTVRFRWGDDGLLSVHAEAADLDGDAAPAFPAVYCRHCGRSGWGVTLASVGEDLHADDARIRAKHLSKEGRFRALLTADTEADRALAQGDITDAVRRGLRFFAVRDRLLLDSMPGDDDVDLSNGAILPVLTLVGPDADSDSHDDLCPACQQADGIRFLGSAISTLLSVSISTIFGAGDLDGREKKALVFADSVQDAAHRAGFVQSRSHTLSLRAALGRAIASSGSDLTELADSVLRQAGDDRFDRYRLLDPVFADREKFRDFWQMRSQGSIPRIVRSWVSKRLAFDVALEFGLQSHVGRTLERTASASVRVEAGTPQKLATLTRPLLAGFETAAMLDDSGTVSDETLVVWVRGVLERMRTRGAIQHPWLSKYLQQDGNRWQINGGRLRSEGMPAFPPGRPAPAFPRVGGAAVPRGRENLDAVTSAQSWYAVWTHKVLRVSASDGGRLATLLLRRLATANLIETLRTDSQGEVFALTPESIIVTPVTDDQLNETMLRCDTCRDRVFGAPNTIAELDGAPCTVLRCPGHLARAAQLAGYYRTLYRSRDMRRVVAREHTSLLDPDTRLAYENGFKNVAHDPGAPNVLVATPTLEMGIDIGDLSTVMLSSLPRRVSSFLQRVGRAGRLTGNALDIAYVSGRGENLPLLGNPLLMINGAVRPPATYLDADEILRRQYLASIADRFAADAARPHPQRATAAIGSTEPGTFLGELIAYAEEEATTLLDFFLGGFDSLSDASIRGLRAWVIAPDGDGTSALAAHLHAASQRWTASVSALEFRRTEIENSLEDLKKRAELEDAEAEDKRAYRTAVGALALTRRQLKELRGEHWISVLEEHGILPNYTLLDDTVTLDVTLNWIDPETDEYHSDGVSYSRGASVALRELAPGATFYAHGAAVRIDAIDLGHQAEAVRPWAYCAACGYSVALDATGSTAVIVQCPRCGDTSIADARQHIDTVELDRVSAEVRRDEALITDSSEDRRRESFTVVVAADVDRASVQDEWFVEGNGFGATLLRSVDIRWINLGRRGASATTRTIAGMESAAPLFRVCGSCGKLDRSVGSNRREEHRPWCPLRTAIEEDSRTIALSRTLRTQAVALRLPPSLTIGDSFAVPSLAASVLLGLREQLGGAPDHIEIVSTALPDAQGGTVDALLVHDVVPGGTGYLAELADSAKVWNLLLRAYRVVRDCTCTADGRLACHDCLLPFAAGSAETVSRQTAQRLLRTLLVGSSDDEPEEERAWTVTSKTPAAVDPESTLEQLFRKKFIERVSATGAVIKEVSGPSGNRIDVTGTGGGARWSLIPQLFNGSSLPDFTLRSQNPAVPDVVIFADGFQFHASVAHNRLADDAHKRELARLDGAVVLGLTWDDLVAEPQAPSWYSEHLALKLMGPFGYNRELLSVLVGSPMDFLMWWMTAADPWSWRSLADAVPLLLRTPANSQPVDEATDPTTLATSALSGSVGASSGDSMAWSHRVGPLVISAVAVGGDPKKTRAAVVLDDSVAGLAHPDFRTAWRLWLQMSNLLALRTLSPVITTTSLASEKAPAALGPVDLDFSGEWAVVIEQATEQEKAFARELVDLGVPAPVIGLESDDGIPIDFAWVNARVAVALDWDDENRGELTGEGWTVFDADAVAVHAAVTGGGH